VYVEQRLTTCEVCCEKLALQYFWAADRPPTHSQDRISVRCFACPSCGHPNGFFTLLDAFAFQLKLVPGPQPDVCVPPNAARRLLTLRQMPRSAPALDRGTDWERRLRAMRFAQQALGRLEPWWPIVTWGLYRGLAG
jgi:hypothetical protein